MNDQPKDNKKERNFITMDKCYKCGKPIPFNISINYCDNCINYKWEDNHVRIYKK